MKRMIKNTSLILLILISASSFTACVAGLESILGGSEPIDEDLVGKWDYMDGYDPDSMSTYSTDGVMDYEFKTNNYVDYTYEDSDGTIYTNTRMWSADKENGTGKYWKEEDLNVKNDFTYEVTSIGTGDNKTVKLKMKWGSYGAEKYYLKMDEEEDNNDTNTTEE